MKRILYLSRGGSIGGSQRQLYYILANLDRRVYEPIVVCPRDGKFVTLLQQSGVKVYVLPLHPWRKFPAVVYRYFDAERLAKFARRHQVAMIHSSDLWLNGYLIWVAERLKIPSILHVRTPILTKDVWKHRCSRATSIIAISQHVKQDLLRAGIRPQKITQIDDAVDLELFGPKNFDGNVLRRDFSPGGEVLIGIVGRIEPSKRQLDFLRAAEQVIHRANKNVTFFVIGEVRSRSYFEEISRFVDKNGLKRHVRFTGERDDMPQVLSSLDILVSFSGGSVMYEAMACGKVVVSAGFTTEQNSVHIQNECTGILINSREISILVKALVRLMSEPQLRIQIGRGARKWAESKLSHTRMVALTQKLYGQLLER